MMNKVWKGSHLVRIRSPIIGKSSMVEMGAGISRIVHFRSNIQYIKAQNKNTKAVLAKRHKGLQECQKRVNQKY